MGLLRVWPLNSHSVSFRSVQPITAGLDCAEFWHLQVLRKDVLDVSQQKCHQQEHS